ncbi:hypothetical protein K3495_g8165 [Podosphaera aphanis]|nr:hypothetical protein K3495_g8165 [Podosphaera aphanis]
MSPKSIRNEPERRSNLIPKASDNSKTPLPLPDIQYSPNYMKILESFVLSYDILFLHGYVLEPLSAEMLERKKKCANCAKPMSKGKSYKGIEMREKLLEEKKRSQNKEPHEPFLKLASTGSVKKSKTVPLAVSSDRPIHKPDCTTPVSILDENNDKSNDNGTSSKAVKLVKNGEKGAPETIMRCKFHQGIFIHTGWSCCNQHKYSKGCTANENHTVRYYSENELESQWEYFVTPKPFRGTYQRAAVAIDCEMGGTKSGESELIRLSAVDYFTSEILINHLVYPDEQIDDYRTRYSGVSRYQMENARRKRQCLFGKKAAREALWRFVGPNTIIIGHSANNDLTALRWIHERVIDTIIVEEIHRKEKAEAEAKKAEVEQIQKPLSNVHISSSTPENHNLTELVTPQENPKSTPQSESLSLKHLIKTRLGRDIQVGRKGHDSLEDAIATRDLTHWNVIMRDMGRLMQQA